MIDGRSLIIGITLGMGISIAITAAVAQSNSQFQMRDGIGMMWMFGMASINPYEHALAAAGVDDNGLYRAIKTNSRGQVICAPEQR